MEELVCSIDNLVCGKDRLVCGQCELLAEAKSPNDMISALNAKADRIINKRGENSHQITRVNSKFKLWFMYTAVKNFILAPIL